MAKVAEVMDLDDGPNSSGPRHPDVLTLKCPVLVGTNLRRTPAGEDTLTVTTLRETASAQVHLDVSGLDTTNELFCAEIIREMLYRKADKRGLLAVWSNGLVLQRTMDRMPEGVKVSYERVGRFWMEWPMDRSSPGAESGARVRSMFSTNKAQVIGLI
jgi:hypothetical protein